MKKERIIYDGFYSYDDYVKDCMPDEESNLSYEAYVDYMEIWLGDERMNLNETLDGVIVAFADLGLWNGRREGMKILGGNLNSIFCDLSCEEAKWFCDRSNVKATGVHHDGRNHYLFRLAKSKSHADYLIDLFQRGELSQYRFMRNTKSLRPFVAKIYGW